MDMFVKVIWKAAHVQIHGPDSLILPGEDVRNGQGTAEHIDREPSDHRR
jgi:hypothetical protein